MGRRYLLSRPLAEAVADLDLPGRIHSPCARCRSGDRDRRVPDYQHQSWPRGRFSEAKKVHDVCASQNIPVWCGGMLESGVGRAHNIALSTLENFRLPGDVSASKRYWRED